MIDLYTLSSVLAPVINDVIDKTRPVSILTAGQMASACLQLQYDTVLQHLTSPYSQQQLVTIGAVELAIISYLTESMPQYKARHWLGTIKNLYAPHIILISHPSLSAQRGWQFSDYLAMGMKHIAGTKVGLQVYSYAIENYQLQHDWLNSRFWANPELYDKYRW